MLCLSIGTAHNILQQDYYVGLWWCTLAFLHYPLLLVTVNIDNDRKSYVTLVLRMAKTSPVLGEIIPRAYALSLFHLVP